MRIALLLRCAACLAPREVRAEWLAEWGGELAYVRRVGGSKRALAFSLGAFHDALWLRRNGSTAARDSRLRAAVSVESPVRCLLLLTALAAAGILLGLRASSLSELSPARYRDPDKLAMVSLHGRRPPAFPAIPIAEFRSSANRVPGAFAVAFYAPVSGWTGSRKFVVALASRNLFDLLGVPAPGQGLILGERAWRRYFKSSRSVVGRMVEVAGAPAPVSGVLPDNVWRLAGFPDAWLLDDARLAQLPAQARGYMVARLRTPVSTNVSWLMSTPDEGGENEPLTLAPLGRPQIALGLLLLVGMWLLLVAPAVAPIGLSAYAPGRHAPAWSIRLRGWIFLAVKIALLAPAGLGAALALGVVPMMPGALGIGGLLASRWAIEDQRRRCPVCLRRLGYPVRIGEASHTFLDWYGTEFVCARGHGLLHVAEVRTSCYAPQSWLFLDPSWTS